MNLYDFILQNYGSRVSEALLKKCPLCYRHERCSLLPITSKGDDCPYYMDSLDGKYKLELEDNGTR